MPMRPSLERFTIGAVASEHFAPSGEAMIALAGLALPVAAIAPDDLGEAAGVGALMLELEPGLVARWDEGKRAVSLGASTLLLDRERLAFTGAAVRSLGEARRLLLTSTPGGDLALARRDEGPVSYFTGPDGGESVVLEALADLRMPRPVTVAGDRVELRLPAASVTSTRAADGVTTLSVAGMAAPPDPKRPLAFALSNAVLRASQPFGGLVTGQLEGDAIVDGLAILGYRLQGLQPSLPDPYASNLTLDRRFGAGDRGVLVSALRWGAVSSLTFQLPAGVVFDGVAETTAFAGQGGSVATASVSGAQLAATFDRIGDLLDFERLPKIVLLDVSTAASRLGVALRPPRDANGEFVDFSELKPPQVAGLDLAVDGRMMVLLMLPSVQWEPVRAVPGPEPFPDEVRFANSGVPTIVDVPSVALVPMTPLGAHETLLKNFADPAPRASRARFTLPFGMLASARLAPPAGGRGATLGQARPASADGMEGAHQLRIEAADPTLAAGETPALPGATLQLPVAIPTGGGPSVSILGDSVTTIFNAALGPGGADPLVPVTRIDLAGHGASLMSAWANPDDPETGVAKVEFQVLNGRTAHEVVQVKSILLPYFAPVVRTITLERRGSAVITREDSGWIAVRDGAYRASLGSGIVTHPGCVTRASRIANIRETATRISAGGHDFVAVRFDTDLVLEGAGTPVPARRQEGWVKLSIPVLTPTGYADLIRRAGPMGGALDATIAIGGGAHRMRLHGVGVGVAGAEFAMVGWGSLAFPGGGDWSVLEAADGVGAPGPVAADRGLPLIRHGVAGAATSAPWRFADPEDLLDPASPDRDYGLLHSMGTQRAFFRRPRIEPAQPDRIVSTERPVLADPLVLATATGPFPRQADAVPTPTAAYALEARADGSWRLDGPATFPAGVPRRTIRAAGTVRSDLDYSAATVTYAFDTSQPATWRFKLEGARKIMAHTTLGDVMTVIADFDAEAGRATSFAEPQIKLGGPFDIVQDLLTIMQDLGVPARPRGAHDQCLVAQHWRHSALRRRERRRLRGHPWRAAPHDCLRRHRCQGRVRGGTKHRQSVFRTRRHADVRH
jgi:hypothetical protein